MSNQGRFRETDGVIRQAHGKGLLITNRQGRHPYIIIWEIILSGYIERNFQYLPQYEVGCVNM